MEERTRRKVLIIGWDGGTWTVFRPLVARGLMPHLKSLMDRGCHGTLESTIPYLTPTAWTTLMTGLAPQRHGIIGFHEKGFVGDAVLGGEKDLRPVSSRSVGFPTLLDYFADADRRVLSINVPVTWPPRPVNGILVTGMMTPCGARDFTWPPELRNELAGYVIDTRHRRQWLPRVFRSTKHEFEGAVREWDGYMRRRTEVICRLGREHAWDFGIVILSAPDRIFHRTWPLVETYLGRGRAETGVDRALEMFFRNLDDSLGAISSALDSDVTMLVSDHGSGLRCPKSVHPNVCLEANGFLFRRKGSTAGRSHRGRLARVLRRAARRCLESVLSHDMAARFLARVETREVRVLRSLDLTRTVAHFVNVDNGELGAVRLRRETTDRLSAAERAALIDTIIAALRTMTDPRTGESVVLDVAPAEKYFPDATVDYLPEIVMRFREGYSGRVDPVEKDLIGETPVLPAGWHRAGGMYVLAGGPVSAVGESMSLHLADVAPITLYLAGLAVPRAMNGQVPFALLDAEYVRTHPLRRSDPSGEGATTGEEPHRAYTDDEARDVRDRLRDIGYLE
ncbi:MAG TPA: alkaline phosphatase family protein [Planctomycetota bacterium]|nr:alkaline phosphatase family protein [Planctomycetota bacterium]